MEESHRLKALDECDPKLLMQLYNDTEGLRRKLASQIDASRFGYDYEEILSWFTVKFLYLFEKYHQSKPTLLKGYVINGLCIYKQRLVKELYNEKVKITNSANYEDVEFAISKKEDYLPPLDDSRLEYIKKFLKNTLSEDAYFLFELELDPPPYILKRLDKKRGKRFNSLPPELILDFIGFDPSDNGNLEYVSELRAEINKAFKKCRNAVTA